MITCNVKNDNYLIEAAVNSAVSILKDDRNKKVSDEVLCNKVIDSIASSLDNAIKEVTESGNEDSKVRSWYRGIIRNVYNRVVANFKILGRLNNNSLNLLHDKIISLSDAKADKKIWKDAKLEVTMKLSFTDSLSNESYRKAFSKFFGKYEAGAGRYLFEQFKEDLFKVVTIDYDYGTHTTSNSDLCENINNYQLRLLNSITDYISNTDLDKYKQLKNDCGDFNEFNVDTFSKVLDTMKEMLDGVHDVALDAGYYKTISGEEDLGFDAVTAYFTLTHFDDLIQEAVGYAISFNSKLKNKIVDSEFGKYKFATDTSHKHKSWNEDADDRTAIDNMSKMTKMVLSNIPINTGVQGLKSKMSVAKFTSTITKLRYCQHMLSVDSYYYSTMPTNNAEHKLYYILSNIHEDCNTFVPVLFQFLNTREAHDLLIGMKDTDGKRVFTDTDMLVIKSAYTYIFNQEKGCNSIYDIQSRTGSSAIIDIVKEICDLCNDVTDVNYTEVQLDGSNTSLIIRPKFNEKNTTFYIANTISSHINNLDPSETSIICDYYKAVEGGELSSSPKYSLSAEDNIVVSFSTNSKDKSIIDPLSDSNSVNITFTKNGEGVDIIGELIQALEKPSTDLIYDSLKSDTIQSLFRFINDTLGLNFFDDENVVKLIVMSNNNKDDMRDILNSLVQTAIKSRYTIGIENDAYENQLSMNDYLESRDLMKLFRSDGSDKYFKVIDGSIVFQTVRPLAQSKWIDPYVNVTAIIEDDNVKSTSKNKEGKSEANYSTSFLGGNVLHYIIENIKHSKDISNNADENDPTSIKRTAAGQLLFTKHLNIYKGAVIANSATSKYGTTKLLKNMNIGELGYKAFVYDFCDEFSRNGNIYIQPTTYSDKTKFVQFRISLNTVIKTANGQKSLMNFSGDELVQLYLDTVGLASKAAYENVIIKYRKILKHFGRDFNEPNIDYLLNSLNRLIHETIDNRGGGEVADILSTLAMEAGVEIISDTDYILRNGDVYINPILRYEAEVLFNDASVFSKEVQHQKELYLKELLNNNVSFPMDIQETGSPLDRLQKSDDPIIRAASKMFDDKDALLNWYNNWVSGDTLILAKDKDGNPITYSSKNLDGAVLNPMLDKYFMFDMLLSNNMRQELTGTEYAHPYKKAKVNASQVVKQFNGDDEDLRLALWDDFVKLNARGGKSAEIARTLAVKKSNLLQGIQLKRNVIVPATLHYVNTNERYGVSKYTKVAVIDDIPAEVWSFTGQEAEIDAMDGSGFESPIASRFVNNSLGSQKVGSDKKPIGHSIDKMTNSATLFKFATFEINNERMRRSLMSNVRLLNLFKKMHNQQWRNFSKDNLWNTKDAYGNSYAIDLINGNSYYGLPKNTLDIMSNDRELFYRRSDGTHVSVRDLGIINGVYYTKESACDVYGNLTSEQILFVVHLYDNNSQHTVKRFDSEDALEEYTANIQQSANQHSINSIYELWTALGGAYSMELGPNGLQYSEISNDIVSNYICSVCDRVVESPSGIQQLNAQARESQSQFHLPLKDMFISMALNLTAVKNGTANVNGVNKWTDDSPLSYMTFDYSGYGIQMDADHEAANSEMTEFTQVITALEANGRTHHIAKQIYRALGTIATQASKVEIDQIVKLLDSNEDKLVVKDKVYEVIARSIIEHILLNKDRATLGEAIVNNLANQFHNQSFKLAASKFKVPFSDPNIYSQILPTFASNINNKSVKRKFPGSGDIMCPGYGVMQTFKFELDGQQFCGTLDDVYETALNYYDETDLESDQTEQRRQLIANFLLEVQNMQESTELDFSLEIPVETRSENISLETFKPNDIIDVRTEDGNHLATIKLTSIGDYYKYLADPAQYIKQSVIELSGEIPAKVLISHSAQAAHDLDPAKISWKYVDDDGKVRDTNIFALSELVLAFSLEKKIKKAKKVPLDVLNVESLAQKYNINKNGDVTEIADKNDNTIVGQLELKNGVYTITGNSLEITDDIIEILPDYSKVIVNSDNPFLFKNEDGTFTKNALLAYVNQLNKVRKDIQKLLDLIDLGKFYHTTFDRFGRELSKVLREIVPGSLKNEPAELIVSNMYADLFGIEGLSVQQIREQGYTRFIKKPLPLEANSKYDIAFRTNNGNNTFVTFDKVDLGDKNCKVLPFEGHRIKIIEEDNGLGKVTVHKVLVDSEGHKILTIGRLVKVDDYRYDKKKKEFTKGGKAIQESEAKRLSTYKSKYDESECVYKVYNYVSKYEQTYISKINGRDSLDSSIVWKIDRSAIQNSMTFTEDATEKDKNSAVNNLIGTILAQLYSMDTYSSAELATNLGRNASISLKGALSSMAKRVTNPNYQLLLNDLLNVVLLLKEGTDESSNEFSESQLNTLKSIYDAYYEREARDIYNSWEQSLYYTAARIPAQSHQSFMQMKAVAYSGSDKNICYVSHWQTWLLGSDYDIDKAYIMGLGIGNDGKLVGYSKAFDLSTPETLNASLKLPLPEYKNILYNDTEAKNKLIVNGELLQKFDISNYVQLLANVNDDASRIKILADCLTLLYNNSDDIENIEIISSITDDNAEWLVRKLRQHSNSRLPDELLDIAYKNFVSANIQNVIQNTRNMISAYTPIEMEDLREASAHTTKNETVQNLNLINPMTKWIMQFQNMTGKVVIGIAAIGEKVFFNESFYWNEGLQKGDADYIKHLTFNQQFSRIDGRYSGNPRVRTINCLADINLDNVSVETLNKIVSEKSRLDWLISKGYSEEAANDKASKFTIQDYENMCHTKLGADIMISQLLSAATDNAKELILEKINCDKNFAKDYLHLIMMGFDIKDIVKFMTSGGVETVAYFLKSNMFTDSASNTFVNQAIGMAKGKLNVNKYITGSTKWKDEEDGRVVVTKNTKIFANKLIGNYEFAKFLNENFSKDTDNGKHILGSERAKRTGLGDLLLIYILKRLEGKAEPLSKYLNMASLTKLERGLFDAVEYVVYRIQSCLTDSYTLEDYLSDIDEFLKVENLSEETSKLGNVFLGLNKGIPTDKTSLISKFNLMEDLVASRESEFKINKSFKFKNEEAFNDLVDTLCDNANINKFDLDERQKVSETLKKAFAYGIAGDFNAELWLFDKKLTLENIINPVVGGATFASDEDSYRLVCIDYYNLIKGTWNVFHIMEKLPLYKALVTLLKVDYAYDKEASAKSNIITKINKDLRKTGIKVNQKLIDSLAIYADNLIFNKFFLLNPVIVILNDEKAKLFGVDGNIRESESNHIELDLKNAEDRATFKMWFESNFIKKLKSIYKNSKFILDLYVEYDKNGMSYLRLPLDLSSPYSTVYSAKKYQTYISDLYNLKYESAKEYGFNNLLDLVMLYNHITNMGKYGSSRLTSLFQSFVDDENTYLARYYKWLGEFDKSGFLGLDLLDYNINDAKLFIAKTVHASEVDAQNGKSIIRTWDASSSRYVYKQKDFKGNWQEIPYFQGYNNSSINPETMKLFRKYWVGYLPNSYKRTRMLNCLSPLEKGDKNSAISKMVTALKYFIADGYLEIDMDCK